MRSERVWSGLVEDNIDRVDHSGDEEDDREDEREKECPTDPRFEPDGERGQEDCDDDEEECVGV